MDNRQIINYRPLSVLELLGQLFENIIKSRIYKLLERQGEISHSHHGFREDLGTHTAIATAIELVAIDKEKKEQG